MDNAHPHAPVSGAELPVNEVTIMEDRALVVRKGSVTLKAGLTRVEVRGVSPVLVDKTISVQLEEGSEINTGDVRVERSRRVLDSDLPAAVEGLKKALRETEGQIELLKEEKARCLGRVADLALMSDQLLRAAVEEVSWGQQDQQRWNEGLSQLASSQEPLVDQMTRLDFEMEEREGDLTRLRERLGQTQSPSGEHEATLVLDLYAPKDRTTPIEIRYLVPSACWRPWHRARLTLGESTQIQFQCEACVWQNTGEDWTDVTLRFSTERQSIGLEPPLLRDDLLAVQRRNETIIAKEREQTIYDTGLGRGTGADSEKLAGIDDGGEAVTLTSPRRVTVPSDGRPHRVPLFEFESEGELDRVLMSEMVEAVVLRSRQPNPSRFPLLAGPVDLLRGGGYCGRTRILYVSPGERFALGWGADTDFRVHRRVQTDDSRHNMLGSWSAIRHEIDVHISNLGNENRTVLMTERVPVSEIEKVGVETYLKETTDRVRPDQDGFLKWTLSLGPYDHRTVRLVYNLRKHDDVGKSRGSA